MMILLSFQRRRLDMVPVEKMVEKKRFWTSHCRKMSGLLVGWWDGDCDDDAVTWTLEEMRELSDDLIKFGSDKISQAAKRG